MIDCSPCPTLMAHLDDSRQIRAEHQADIRELYTRAEALKEVNAEQTALLQSINAMLVSLVEQNDKTFRLYRWAEGIGKLAGLAAGAVLVAAAWLELLRFFGANR